MKKDFIDGDLVITNNFTLKQDVNIVKEDGSLKVMIRLGADEIFKWLNNYCRSNKEKNFKIYFKSGTYISNEFEYKHLMKFY